MKRILFLVILCATQEFLASEDLEANQESAEVECSVIHTSTKTGSAVVSGANPDYVRFKDCMKKKGFTHLPKSIEVRYMPRP